MTKFSIDGSHFDAVARARAYLLLSGYDSSNVELVCDEESEVYTLQTTGVRPTVIRVFKY